MKPKGYYTPPDPYRLPTLGLYDLRAAVKYARDHGKQPQDLTDEELKKFVVKLK